MKIWHVVYERIDDLHVVEGEIIALIHQYVRDDDRQSELREFSAWAPALIVKN
jgi:hypothetical protein